MKLKKLTILLLILVLGVALPLTGCTVTIEGGGGGGGDKKDPTDNTKATVDETVNAKATVDAFIKALKEMNAEALLKLVAKSAGPDEGESIEFGEEGSDETKALKDAFKQLKFTYKSGEVAKDANETTLSYEAEAVNAMLFAMAFLAGQDVSNLPTTKSDVEIKLVKEDGNWKILNVEDVVAAAYGMADMPGAFD
ncbi:MAG: hypothetical protein GX900_00065 [Clostridiaceae bacterium]|nr:hypothetical protein [Clostridiaceae bacterium]